MIDLDARLPRSTPRPLPARIPAGAHILSHSDLRAIARRFGNRDSAILGEELLPFILHHKMLGADSGRIIPREILTELGNGDAQTGKRVLRRFLQIIRQHGKARGGRVDPEPGQSFDPDAAFMLAGDVIDRAKEFERLLKENRFINQGGFRPGTPSAPVLPIRPQTVQPPTEQDWRGGRVLHGHAIEQPDGNYGRGGAVRMSKADAGYDEIGSEGRICAICSMFRRENRCTLVNGFISRTGTRKHFDKAAK